jgi:ribonuclease J
VQVDLDKGDHDVDRLQRVVRKSVGKFVSDRTKRRPMIVPVVLSV